MPLKELLGEELYNQVVEKAGDSKLAVISDGNWFPKQKFDDVNNENKDLKGQLSERDVQLEGLRGSAEGNEGLQTTIDGLKEANRIAKENYENSLSSQKFNYELERSLLAAKVRNPLAIKGLLDNEVIKLDEAGNITGLSEQLEGLKTSDGYLFESESGTPPPATYTPGSGRKTNPPAPTDEHQAGIDAFESLKLKGKI